MSDIDSAGAAVPVVLRHLSLRSFRNYVSLDLDLSGGLSLIAGANGHGKTNFIEAVYFLCLGRSFRERREHRLIRYDDDRAALAGDFARGNRRNRVEFRLERKEGVAPDGGGIHREGTAGPAPRQRSQIASISRTPTNAEGRRGSRFHPRNPRSSASYLALSA